MWDLEQSGKSRITTIQAALVLSITAGLSSMDKLGTMYLEQAVYMAHDLGLFGPNKEEKNAKMQKARIFTAWAVFSWQAMYDYFYFRPPHLDRPPQIPLPDPTIHAQWYGEIWVIYPHTQTLTPLYLGHKFQSEAALHTIMNEIGLRSFGNQSPLQPLSPTEMIAFKEKLDAWKNELVEVLTPERLIFPLHLGLQ